MNPTPLQAEIEERGDFVSPGKLFLPDGSLFAELRIYGATLEEARQRGKKIGFIWAENYEQFVPHSS